MAKLTKEERTRIEERIIMLREQVWSVLTPEDKATGHWPDYRLDFATMHEIDDLGDQLEADDKV